MHVNAENTHVGYLLGRQFAVIEYAQQRADSKTCFVDAQLLDMASKLPQRAFPNLFRSYYQYISKIEKCNKGMAIRLECLFDEISIGFKNDTDIPDQLSNEEQCLFFLGYRLQKMDLNSAQL